MHKAEGEVSVANLTRGHIKQLTITAGVLCFCLVTLFVFIPTQIEQAPQYDLSSLSPAFFPELAVLLMGGLAVVLLISQVRRVMTGLPPVNEGVEPLTREEEIKAAQSMVVAIVYAILLVPLGYLITTTLAVGVLLRLQGPTPIRKLIAIPVLTTIGTYLFFLHVMNVHFPMGKIFE
jgi:putative tricarboxylic transport membrane protein